jgi:threonine dehydrogenase-like Zn-dependent dehydrogenase
MTREARTVWFEEPAVARLRAEPLPEPKLDEVVVAGLFSGVSAGTERLVLLGEVPPAVREAMALPTMRGAFTFPIAYGYALVGEVDGQSVFTMHPHADVAVVPRAMVRKLPNGVPGPRLTLAANLETALNVVWDAGVSLGDRIVVLGLGVVGLLAARLAAKAGARVVGVDPDPARRSIAAALEVEAERSPPAKALAEADAILEASGVPAALRAAIEGAGVEAKIVVASWYGEAPIELALGGAFHPKRIQVISSQVGRLPPHRLARFDAARRFAVVTELLEDAALDAIVAPPVPLSDAPRLYAELARGDRASPPHRVFDLTR